MVRVVLHPGAPKTATTYLQERVFARHPQIVCIGRPFHRSPGYGEVHHALTRMESHEEAVACIRGYFDAARTAVDEESKVILLSDENLFYAPITSVLAARLSEAVPHCHVLLTIRNQIDALRSLYTSDRAVLKGVPEPWAGRHVGFDAWFAHAFSSLRSGDGASLDYWSRYESFARVLGAGRVHVLLYEDLARDRAGFLGRLSRVLGTDELVDPVCAGRDSGGGGERVNPTPSRRLARYRALRSWLFPGRSLTQWLPGAEAIRAMGGRMLSAGAPDRVSLTDAQLARVNELFAPGNRRLSKACGRDLAASGYPM